MFKLPDVGEGLTEAEIVTWKVKVGDTVKVNDVIVEIETAKSLVELPCPYAGTVTELLAAEGETVNVGAPIIAVETGDAVSGSGSRRAGRARGRQSRPRTWCRRPKDDEAVEPGLIGGPAPGGRTSVLVGYGPRTTEAKRRPRKAGSTPAGSSPAAAQVGVQHAFTPHATPAPDVSHRRRGSGRRAGRVRRAHDPTRPPAPASRCWRSRRCASSPRTSASTSRPSPPPARRHASPATTCRTTRRATAAAPEAAAVAAPRPQVTGERETRVPVKGVRKMTAQAMVASAFTAPHVTEWITVDATRTMKMVERLREHRDFRDVKVSPLLIVARAVCLPPSGVRRRSTPAWDEAAQEIVLKHYVNLGIAAATPRGLMVPNIKDADAARRRRAGSGARRAHHDRARRQDAAGRHERRHASRSPTSASSASTPARRSSTRASRRSSAWARSASSPGSWATRSGRAGSPRSRCRSTTASSTASRARASSPTSRQSLEDPGNALLF